MRNRIEVDELDPFTPQEYLPEDSPIAEAISDYLQGQVDAYMAGLREDNEINLAVTKAAINALRFAAVNIRSKGVHVREPEEREPWRLLGMTHEEWDASHRADRTRGAYSGYWHWGQED